MGNESEQLRELAKQLLKTSDNIKIESDRLMRRAEELDIAIDKNRSQNQK